MVIAIHFMHHSQLVQCIISSTVLQTNLNVQKKKKNPNQSNCCRLWPRFVRFHSKSALSITQKCKSQKKYSHIHTHTHTQTPNSSRKKKENITAAKIRLFRVQLEIKRKKSNQFQKITEFYGFFVLRPLSSCAPFKSQPKKERFWNAF